MILHCGRGSLPRYKRSRLEISTVRDFRTYRARLGATADARAFGRDEDEPVGLTRTVLENCDLRRVDGGRWSLGRVTGKTEQHEYHSTNTTADNERIMR
jgi:hypothetical protein